MKYFSLLGLLLLLTLETSTQTLSDSSGLLVLQKKWHINFLRSPNSALDEDPFRANDEARQANQDQKEYLRVKAIRQKLGLPQEEPRVRTKPIKPTGDQSRNEDSILYTYQVKVQNNGAKTIEQIVWNYVFFNSTTNQEVGRHTFISKTSLKPNETDNLVEKLLSPPTGSINANDARKKLSKLYIEQINIKSIQFADGSVWQAGSK
jgi:hypothetical protein